MPGLAAPCFDPGVAAPLPACAPAVLHPQGPIGLAERTILLDSLAIMLVVVIPTILATVAFAWWFRASNSKAHHLPNWNYSGRIELLVWSAPVLVVLFLGGLTWIGAHQLDPAQPLPSKGKALEVQVVSLDWKWLFIYPDQQIAAVNELVIPAGVPVHFTLTSASVMNAFFIPQLGGMIYTMNGMADQLNLQADRPGVYYGQSAHYSGDGFSGMHFEVRAVPQQAFNAWIDATRSAGPALNPDGYKVLSQQSQNVAPFTYRSAAPNLFQQIVAQQLPAGPGPQVGRPSPAVSPKSER